MSGFFKIRHIWPVGWLLLRSSLTYCAERRTYTHKDRQTDSQTDGTYCSTLAALCFSKVKSRQTNHRFELKKYFKTARLDPRRATLKHFKLQTLACCYAYDSTQLNVYSPIKQTKDTEVIHQMHGRLPERPKPKPKRTTDTTALRNKNKYGHPFSSPTTMTFDPLDREL